MGCTSPTTERFPEAREMSRGRSPRDISRAKGNLEVGGDVQPRDQREFSIPGILARISFIFSRSTMRFHFVILVPFSKHEILKEKISFSSRTPRFIRQKSRLVSKLEIFKKIFLISSRTTRFRETKISISSQKIHISRCILLIII